MNTEPSPLIDQCVRRVLVERGGSPVALQVNASLAHRRLGAPNDAMIAAELELVVALASSEHRDALAARVREIGARWGERAPARRDALARAADMLVTGVAPAPGAMSAASPPMTMAAAPRVAVTAPAPALAAQAAALAAPALATPALAAPAPDAPVPSVRSRAPIVVLAVLALGAAAGVGWLVTRGGGKKDAVKAASSDDLRREAERRTRQTMAETERQLAYKGDEPKAAEPAPTPMSPEELVAASGGMPSAQASLGQADTVEALGEMQRLAVDTGDWDLLGRTFADEILHWGPDAGELVVGRDAALAELRELLPIDQPSNGPQMTITASWGGRVENDIAWTLDDLSWTHARPNKKPSTTRFLVSRIAMRRGDRWEVVASAWARRTSDSRLAAASAAGVLPALAPIPTTANDAAPQLDFVNALATRESLESFVATIDGVAALGSDAERDEGSRAVAKRYRKLGGKIYPAGGSRLEITPTGRAAWLAANVELVSASKASGDVVLPYRMLAVLVLDPSTSTWKAAMLHWSAGGPVPRVKGAEKSADESSDAPADDPSAVPVAEALTGAELRAAFSAVRESVEACRGVASADDDATDDGADDDAPVEEGAAPPPPPRVLVKVVATVTAEGAVDGVDIEGDWANTAHAGCVEEVITQMTFRAPGAPQTVRYPFAL